MEYTFTYSATVKCEVKQSVVDVLCIYFDDRCEITVLEFFSGLDDALRENDMLPDCVVVLASTCLITSFTEIWKQEKIKRKLFVERGQRNGQQYVKNYQFVGWDCDQPIQVYSDTVDQGAPSNLKIPYQQLVLEGLKNLVEYGEVIQIAPPGHVFQHPSGTVDKMFIQARELANSEPEISFVGRCLCQKISAVPGDVEVILIDTMGIYSIVREALSVMHSNARIQSFHSYSDLDKLVPPNRSYFLVVSASTTGGMLQRLGKENGFEPERMLTIIDQSDIGRVSGVLIPLDSLGDWSFISVDNRSETEIELVGEHFSSKAKPPRDVTLGKPHTPLKLKKVLENFGIKSIKPINSKIGASSVSKTICVDCSNMPNIEEFELWLNEELRWAVPLSVDHIIYTDDDSSKCIAKNAAKIISTIKNIRELPKCIPNTQMSREELEKATGILIIAALAGDGGVLREISRDLREYVSTELPRHFLVGLGLPQDANTWIRLEQFLERNASHRKYGFSTWLVLPVGPDHNDNTWDNLTKLSGKAQVVDIESDGIGDQVIEDSLRLVSSAVKGSRNGFLPQTNEEALGLTDGFVFFGDVFDGKLGEVTQAATYLTVASVLQAARDLKDPSSQLKPSGYESVVLSPECFLRFNDNLLQACLLRASHHSELDYSASPHLSKLMKEFLAKVFARHDLPYGAAALEFAAALADGRIKLKNSDKEQLINGALNNLSSSSSALLGFLLIAANPR